MTKYLLIMEDESGVTWVADGFNAVSDAMDEAEQRKQKKGWKLADIIPYAAD